MNIRYKNAPEIIAQVRTVNTQGDDIPPMGDRIAGIQVVKHGTHMGIVQIDVRGFNGSKNLILEFELPELIAAISLATLNAEVS